MEITDDQKLYYLLSKKDNRTSKEERILLRLRDKVEWGTGIAASVDEYCARLGWYVQVRHREETSSRVVCYSEFHVSKLGEEQIKVLWKNSKHNYRNWWKNNIIWIIIGAIVSIFVAALDLYKLLR